MLAGLRAVFHVQHFVRCLCGFWLLTCGFISRCSFDLVLVACVVLLLGVVLYFRGAGAFFFLPVVVLFVFVFVFCYCFVYNVLCCLGLPRCCSFRGELLYRFIVQ